jgi:acetyltransferase-like isoleucine patch superfamily enzyme
LAQNADGRIIFRNAGAHVQIGSIRNVRFLDVNLGSFSRLVIEDDVYVNALSIYISDGAEVFIRRWAGFNGHVTINALEGKRVSIGSGSLFADNVSLSTGDSHSIFDLESQERINFAGDIIIGSRVWVCEGARVMKNAKIGAGSVIGSGALVTGGIPRHSLATGVPAKVIRQNITWDQRLLDKMPPEAAEINDVEI